ncbi:MAG: hypothetical protein IKF99_19260, partial [Oscillospiraceae bacterium]|nr:hypothetical protein [Oscillospiraceae bacterium]
LPAAKKAPPAAYTPPRTIKDRGATAPDTPGKLAKGEFVISSINQNFTNQADPHILNFRIPGFLTFH